MENDTEKTLKNVISRGISMCESSFNCKRSVAIDVVLFIVHSILSAIAMSEILGRNSMIGLKFLESFLEIDDAIRIVKKKG